MPNLRKLLSRLYASLSRYLSVKVIFLLDIFFSVLASFISILFVRIMTDGNVVDSEYFIGFWLIGSLLFSAAAFAIFRTHTVIIRHSTLRELYKFSLAAVVKAAFVIVLEMLILHFLIKMDVTVGSTFLQLVCLGIIDALLTFTLLVFVRFVMIILYESLVTNLEMRKKCLRVLVYGVSDKSVSTIKRLEGSPHYKIVGFLAYGKVSVAHTIAGMKVEYFRDEKDFGDLVHDRKIDAVLFAAEADIKEERDRVIKFTSDLHLKTLIAPSIDDLRQGASPQGIRQIQIEDLLGRPEIKISMNEIVANFKGKTVMVTGAAGSIGSELCRQLAGFGVGRLVLYDNAETPMHNLRLELEETFPELAFVPIIGDVRLERRLDFAFRTWRPQVVFHAAAYKHVPLMEDNPCEAVLVNVAGSRNVADKCVEYGVDQMVMISTDKAVNPTNIMGCTKRLAEIYVQSLGLAAESGEGKVTLPDGSVRMCRTKFVTTRFGNVLGSNGSVIPRFRDQIAKGGPITVTHPDITRFFMTIPEACRLVMEAATMTDGNQIFVFDMGKPVKIDYLARRMVSLAGLEPDKDIKIEYTGLRPGEKLYEEVLSNAEDTVPTEHERIRIAHVRQYSYGDAVQAAGILEKYARAVQIPDMVKYMKEIVPEYVSNNSQFEVFDKK